MRWMPQLHADFSFVSLVRFNNIQINQSEIHFNDNRIDLGVRNEGEQA